MAGSSRRKASGETARPRKAAPASFDAATILESIPDAFYAVDHEWRLTYVNAPAEAMWGRPRDDLLGKHLWQEFPDMVGSPAYEMILRAAHERRRGDIEAVSPVTGRWIRTSACPSAGGLSVYLRDIGERKGAEAALLLAMHRAEAAEREAREAQARLEEAIETMSEGFVLYDDEDRLVLCNSRYRELYAESADLIVPGARFPDLVREGVRRGQYLDAAGQEEAWLAARLAAHRAARGGFEQQLPNGRWVRVLERRTAHGGIVGTRIDVTELKRREGQLARLNEELESRIRARTRSLERVNEKLRRSEERYRALFHHSPTLLYLVRRAADGHFVIEDINAAGLRLTGFTAEQMIGKTTHEIFPKEVADLMEARYAECAEAGRLVEYEISGELPIGEVTRRTLLVPLFAANGKVARIFGTSIDITEARRLEQQLREAQKMQAVGQLAGGVAHDFNNLLTAVLGNIELAMGREKDPRTRHLLEGALRAGERGADLTRQLLAFSRRQRLRMEALDLNERIHGMLDLLRRSLGPAIRIVTTLESGLWRGHTDATQLELAILNLAINARDAMPQGGELRIETRNLAVDDRRRPIDLRPGDYVVVAVIDTGAGMSDEVRMKAFEPFFTTKEVGKGSGLGLAQVYAFAEQSGGRARIASRPGRGTRVELYLPRACGEADPHRGSADDAAPRHGSGTILLVDDEAEVREFAATALRELGYAVREAANGNAALALDAEGAADLFILDYAMPGMNGLDLLRALRGRHPGIPAILITGYAETGAIETLDPRDLVLRKPFKLAELAREVQLALGRRREG